MHKLSTVYSFLSKIIYLYILTLLKYPLFLAVTVFDHHLIPAPPSLNTDSSVMRVTVNAH